MCKPQTGGGLATDLRQPNIHLQSLGATWVKVPGPRTQRHKVSLEAAGFFFLSCRDLASVMRYHNEPVVVRWEYKACWRRRSYGTRATVSVRGNKVLFFLFKCIRFGHSFAVGKYNIGMCLPPRFFFSFYNWSTPAKTLNSDSSFIIFYEFRVFHTVEHQHRPKQKLPNDTEKIKGSIFDDTTQN